MAETAVQTRYRVEGMDCIACATKIETAVGRLPGVERVTVSSYAGTMIVSHSPDATLFPAMKAQIAKLGYSVSSPDRTDDDKPLAPSHVENREQHAWWRTRKGVLTIACGVALVAAYGLGRLFPAIELWVFLAALGIGLVPIARRALSAALAGTPFSIETLMTLEGFQGRGKRTGDVDQFA